jgi:hypothetical protein
MASSFWRLNGPSRGAGRLGPPFQAPGTAGAEFKRDRLACSSAQTRIRNRAAPIRVTSHTSDTTMKNVSRAMEPNEIRPHSEALI